VSKIPAVFSIAPFRFDVTPPFGHSLLGGWIPPVTAIDDPLEAIGYVLLGAGRPIVVCALDWAGLMNGAHLAWRKALAKAAGTTTDRVAVQCVHQHNAPFVCPAARAIAARHSDLPAMYDRAFFRACLARAQHTVRAALQLPQRITHVAHGEAKVERVASNRRVARDAAGRVRALRGSACRDPELIALPEGVIDPMLQTVAFYGEGGRKLVACHYYATHPMSFYQDGRVTTDFCGMARRRRQADEPGCTHIYFSGCAGNVAAGKYNDGSAAARSALTDRIYAGIVASESSLSPRRLFRIGWRIDKILPAPQLTPSPRELAAAIGETGRPLAERLVGAFRLGWLRRYARGTPLTLSCLRLNQISILHLPGELFVEYQLRARAMRRRPVAVSAYGDDGLWYVPTKGEFPAGGYEIGVAFSRDDVDELVTASLRRLLK
jgi:hypothetical protein